VIAAALILGLVVLQRTGELLLARRNTARLLREGAIEIGAGHYPLFILLHGAWLAAIAVSLRADTPIAPAPLALYLLLQLGRIWILATLGRYWTTRVITHPGTPLVRKGPYRFLRHPNYLLVALEIPLLPLVFDMVWIAVLFGLANLALLAWRIRLEEAALAPRRTA
jgi:methyltransferase